MVFRAQDLLDKKHQLDSLLTKIIADKKDNDGSLFISNFNKIDVNNLDVFRNLVQIELNN